MGTSDTIRQLAAQIVAGYVRGNKIPYQDIATVLDTAYQSLSTLGRPEEPQKPVAEPVPAVPIRKSVTPDYIVCLEDGRRLKMLKRHLRSEYDMSPDQYRNKWGLPPDYPMVSPNYAKTRSDLAKEIGLGRGEHRRSPEPVVRPPGRIRRIG
jgi:predicted transcriptional regulator